MCSYTDEQRVRPTNDATLDEKFPPEIRKQVPTFGEELELTEDTVAYAKWSLPNESSDYYLTHYDPTAGISVVFFDGFPSSGFQQMILDELLQITDWLDGPIQRDEDFTPRPLNECEIDVFTC